MTKYKDAVLIVPSQELWVAILEEYWEDSLSVLDWNSVLMDSGVKLPTSACKFGLLDEVYRKNKVCRPVGAHNDFNNSPIVVRK